MNTLDEEEMNHQLQQTKPLKARRHTSLAFIEDLSNPAKIQKGNLPPPLKLSELTGTGVPAKAKHQRQKSQNAYRTTAHPLKNFTSLGMSQACSS